MGNPSDKARVLVVDDSPPTLEVLERNLTAAGYGRYVHDHAHVGRCHAQFRPGASCGGQFRAHSAARGGRPQHQIRGLAYHNAFGNTGDRVGPLTCVAQCAYPFSEGRSAKVQVRRKNGVSYFVSSPRVRRVLPWRFRGKGLQPLVGDKRLAHKQSAPFSVRTKRQARQVELNLRKWGPPSSEG